MGPEEGSGEYPLRMPTGAVGGWKGEIAKRTQIATGSETSGLEAMVPLYLLFRVHTGTLRLFTQAAGNPVACRIGACCIIVNYKGTTSHERACLSIPIYRGVLPFRPDADNLVRFTWDGDRLKEIRAYRKDSDTPYYNRTINYTGPQITSEDYSGTGKTGHIKYVYSAPQQIKEIKVEDTGAHDGKNWLVRLGS